jgi:5-methylcytosine-specific restriction endonuclease McrA
MADDEPITKPCLRCNEQKPLEAFPRARRGPERIPRPLNICRVCNSARVQAWCDANAERLKAVKRAYVVRNAERTKARFARWYSANAAKMKVKNAAYYAAHTAYWRARGRAWAKAHPDKIKARGAKRRREHPEKIIEYAARRRALIRRASGSFTANDVLEIRQMQGDKCAACSRALKRKGQVDHIVSLINGGSNGRRNLQLLCATCNKTKNRRDPIEFMQSRGFLL